MKSVLLAVTAILVANSCLAQEWQTKSFQLPDERRKQAQERQDRFNRRLEASNKRAVRSICDSACKGPARPQRTQPADPFAEVPSWEATHERALTPYEIQVQSN